MPPEAFCALPRSRRAQVAAGKAQLLPEWTLPSADKDKKRRKDVLSGVYVLVNRWYILYKALPGAAGQSGKSDKTIDFRSNIDDLFIIACYNLQALTRRELKVIV